MTTEVQCTSCDIVFWSASDDAMLCRTCEEAHARAEELAAAERQREEDARKEWLWQQVKKGLVIITDDKLQTRATKLLWHGEVVPLVRAIVFSGDAKTKHCTVAVQRAQPSTERAPLLIATQVETARRLTEELRVAGARVYSVHEHAAMMYEKLASGLHVQALRDEDPAADAPRIGRFKKKKKKTV